MNVSLVAAMGKNRELGFHNKLPWHLPDDLKRFKEVTRGHAVIMGRKTFESIGRPLPQRKNIVITRNATYAAPGCSVVHSIEDALREAADDAEIFVIGGAEIYKLALPYANKMYLTFVEAAPQADAYFPEFNKSDWNVVREEAHAADAAHPYPFVFAVFAREKSTMNI
jgi:dihydrofolate reductase